MQYVHMWFVDLVKHSSCSQELQVGGKEKHQKETIRKFVSQIMSSLKYQGSFVSPKKTINKTPTY